MVPSNSYALRKSQFSNKPTNHISRLSAQLYLNKNYMSARQLTPTTFHNGYSKEPSPVLHTEKIPKRNPAFRKNIRRARNYYQQLFPHYQTISGLKEQLRGRRITETTIETWL